SFVFEIIHRRRPKKGAAISPSIPHSARRPTAHGYDCAAIVLAHNHPSGDPRPSPADLSATTTIARHAAVLEIKIVDHLIVAGHQVFSMRKAGML
ncbi:JAB domain-containing protein, partial [Novosphingobium aquiterrae]